MTETAISGTYEIRSVRMFESLAELSLDDTALTNKAFT